MALASLAGSSIPRANTVIHILWDWFVDLLEANSYVVAMALVALVRAMGTTVKSGTTGLLFSFGRARKIVRPGFQYLIPFLQKGCIITDAGSVKGSLVEEIDTLIPNTVHYVGAHPIAGGEQSGLEAANADLLTGAKCIITPTANTRTEALQRVTEFWAEVGMQTITMDADEHDTVFGALSHLPHVVAYALMNTVANVKTASHGDILSMSGGGLKDITRIASSDPVMWRDICLKNKLPVVTLINQFQDALENIKTLIEQDQADALQETFANANVHRGKLAETNT